MDGLIDKRFSLADFVRKLYQLMQYALGTYGFSLADFVRKL